MPKQYQGMTSAYVTYSTMIKSLFLSASVISRTVFSASYQRDGGAKSATPVLVHFGTLCHASDMGFGSSPSGRNFSSVIVGHPVVEPDGSRRSIEGH